MSDLFSDLPEPEWSLVPGFSGNQINRAVEQRSEGCLPEALNDENARIYLLHHDRVINHVEDGHLRALFSISEARTLGLNETTLLLLGEDNGTPRLAGSIPEDKVENLGETYKAIDLRSLAVQEALASDQLGALAQARSFLFWHARHRFCANCGHETESKLGGARRDCPSCEAIHFPRIDPVVIMLVVDGDRCLMGRQHNWPKGMYSALAGFMEPGETMEAAVRREVMEEAGLAIGRVKYCASQAWPFPSSLMLGCIAEATSTEINRDEDELDDCRWFSRKEIDEILKRETTSMSEDPEEEGLLAPTRMSIANLLIRIFACDKTTHIPV